MPGGAAPLRSLAPDLWVADRPLPLIVGDVGARMTVVRLANGGLFIHSPIHLDADTSRALDDLGTVEWVVAPSKVHHFYVAEFAAAYPEARLYAAPGLPAKRRDLRFDGELGDAPPQGTWEEEVAQIVFRGAPMMNEVVFLHRGTRTLILTDLAFNVPENGASKAPLFYWLVGAAGRFGPHRIIRFGIRDRRAARASLDTILGWDFDRVIVSHGDVLESGGRERLAASFSFL